MQAPLPEIAFQEDIAIVQGIPAMRSILEVVCRTTGLGFSAIARVTDERWIACAVHDEIAFGLKPGGELELATTICAEIRGRQKAVLIEDVATDEVYCNHHTPAIYGLAPTHRSR